ncbi:MAG: glycoside hydrolase family 31 protein, partial [Halanaerobacter sp.]
AQRMGIDPSTEEAISFDMTDLNFIKNYFELLHHPLEEDGIDFWWIDWQQGQETELEGLDPLWALNHLHFYDRMRDNRRPVIFSRWGGLGSHRYPIGFSGDTIISWDSLRFQPYFTATASNVAYSWWSHDIGGHCEGQDEAELYTRWVQFGVLSPILRLHSTNEKYLDRRPWVKEEAFYAVVKEAMRFRHALIPYLYTMAWRNHQQGIPLIQPMYYHHSEREEAYNFPNQYYFGSQLLAAPYLNPRAESTNLSRKVLWLPEGDWINFFTGEYYEGDRVYAEYGTLEDMPLFAQAGAIVPLNRKLEWGGVENQTELEIYIFAGADNEFELYEDRGAGLDYQDGAFATTNFIQNWSTDKLQFEISSVTGDKSVVPENRDYKLFFRGVKEPDRVDITVDGQLREIDFSYDQKKETAVVYIPRVHPSNQVTVNLFAEAVNLLSRRDRKAEQCYQLLKSFKMKTRAKTQIEEIILADGPQNDFNLLKKFLTVLTDKQLRAILEVFYGMGVEKIKTDEEEKIILWNNNKETEFNYHFSAWSQEEPDSFSGIIPNFKVFSPQRWDYDRWQLKIDYCDLFALVYNN